MNFYYISGFPVSDELYHHGIKGQRWGIRRYQNPDGTLTAAGKARYGTDVTRMKERDFIRQYNASSRSGRLKNISKIDSTMFEEFKKTEEYKSQKIVDDQLRQMQKELEKQRGPKARLVLTGYDAMFYNEVVRRTNAKQKEIVQKHVDKVASAALKDLGYDDTQAGREYVKRVMSKHHYI